MLLPASDTSPADWVVARWSKTFDGQLVPSGFEACARIFHPARMDGRPVTWTEVAAAFGTVAHGRMDWGGITRHPLFGLNDAAGIFDRRPDEEWLPAELVEPVTGVLRRHTAVADDCFFAWWEGFGGLPAVVYEGPLFAIPGRRYHLLRGDLSDAIGEDGMRASLWWPADQAWFVGSDTDLNTTHVAGTRALVDDLLACAGVEAYEVSPETDFAHRGDDVNV